MNLLNITTKAAGDTLTHSEFNALVIAVKLLQVDRVITIPANTSSGYIIQHNYGQTLNLNMGDYFLEARVYDSGGYPMGIFAIQKVNDNQGRLLFDDSGGTFSGGTAIVTPIFY